MDLNQIRTFVAVARAGNLTRAAERLALSQPAASAHIKALEEQFRTELFVRRAAGLELSQAGHRLLARAEQLLLDADALVAQARGLNGQVSGRLRIGVIPDPDLIRLGPMLAHLRAAAPLLDIALVQGYSHNNIEGVRSGDLQACFALDAGADHMLSTIALRDVTYQVAAPSAWRDDLRQWDLNALARAPWIVPPRHGAHGRLLDQLFRPVGAELLPAVRVDSEAMIRACVEAGLGLGLIRDDIAQQAQRDGSIALRQDLKVSTQLMFAFVTENRHEPALNALIDAVAVTWPGRLPSVSG